MGVTHLICNWCGEVFSDHGHYVKYNILGLGLYYFCSDCQNIPDGHLSLPKETLNRNYIFFAKDENGNLCFVDSLDDLECPDNGMVGAYPYAGQKRDHLSRLNSFYGYERINYLLHDPEGENDCSVTVCWKNGSNIEI